MSIVRICSLIMFGGQTSKYIYDASKLAIETFSSIFSVTCMLGYFLHAHLGLDIHERSWACLSVYIRWKRLVTKFQGPHKRTSRKTQWLSRHCLGSVNRWAKPPLVIGLTSHRWGGIYWNLSCRRLSHTTASYTNNRRHRMVCRWTNALSLGPSMQAFSYCHACCLFMGWMENLPHVLTWRHKVYWVIFGCIYVIKNVIKLILN